MRPPLRWPEPDPSWLCLTARSVLTDSCVWASSLPPPAASFSRDELVVDRLMAVLLVREEAVTPLLAVPEESDPFPPAGLRLSSSPALSLAASATAFAPAGQHAARSTALNAEPIGAITPAGFLGKGVWEKLTEDWGSEETGKFIRAAEVKHGRSAMLATVGYGIHRSGLTLDKISPHDYLSVTEGVKFADLAAMTPLEAMRHVPAGGLTQMFALIAVAEIYELTHKDGKLAEDETVAPGLQPGEIGRASCRERV